MSGLKSSHDAKTILSGFENALPPRLASQLSHLRTFLKPHTDRIYLVGGAVRDLLLGIPIKDIDIEVFGIPPESFDTLMKELGATGCGKNFYVYKWKELDIALPRLEKKVSQGHRGFEVSLATDEKEASMRRDFRMNALMLNLCSGILLDFWNGCEDIRTRQIRIIQENSFREDSLRVLRGMQFTARFGFKISSDSINIMQSMPLDDLSPERIVWEFEKLFHARHLPIGLYYLFALGIAQKLLNLSITRHCFIKTARELHRHQADFSRHHTAYIFLYILAKNLHRPPTWIPERLQLPKHYIRKLKDQPCIPTHITNRFLLGVALKMPIKEWLGSYAPGIKSASQVLNIYNQKNDMGVQPAQLLDEGLSGKELGETLRRRQADAIRKIPLKKL